MRTLRCSSFLTAVAAASLSVAAVPGSVETWDADLAGWDQSTIISTVIHAAAGGNPDGHVLVRKELGAADFDIGTATTTSSDYLGNYAGVIGIEVDLNFGTDNVTNAWVRFRPDVVGNGWRFPLTNVFPTGSWDTYSAPFDANWDDATALANGWEQDEPGVASFADLFSSVGWAEVRFESPQTSTLVGVDNFRLVAIPEPSSLVLAAASLAAAGTLVLRRRRG